MGPIDLNDVALFVRVFERGGFAKAARDLGVPTSTVSRAITRLEESLGARLFARSTRSLRPTADGLSFHTDVAPAVAQLQHAARGVDGGDRAPRGRLRVTAPNDVGSTFLAEVIVEFAERCPNVEVEALLTNRQVNLIEEGVDIALRAAAKMPDSSLITRKIGPLESHLYASLEYVNARGVPATLEDLDRHDKVLFRANEGRSTWTLEGPDGEVSRVVTGHVTGDDHNFVRAAALAGGGIALIPAIMAAPDVAHGRLVRVLPQHKWRGASIFLLHPSARVIPAKVTAFRDFVVESFARRQMKASTLGDPRGRATDKKASRPVRGTEVSTSRSARA